VKLTLVPLDACLCMPQSPDRGLQALKGLEDCAGRGHSFMSNNSLIAVSTFFQVTLNASFPEALGHASNPSEMSAFFHGDVFQARFKSGICTETFDVRVLSMTDIMIKAKQMCSIGPVCLNLLEPLPPSEALIDVPGYRSNFAVPAYVLEALNNTPFLGEEYLRVAIHLRRGDVVNRTQLSHRWIYNHYY